MPLQVSKLVRFLDERYPFALAEEWDNVGLIFGEPKASINKVLLALDVTHDVVKEANENGCGAIITHHPPIFRPIKRIDLSTTQGSLIGDCLKNDIASIALHTNLDSADGGLNDCVCDLLGLEKRAPLLDSGRKRFYKLVTFVPAEAAQKVRDAMFDAGAGVIGKYGGCSFNTEGTGTFYGSEKSAPAVGDAEKFEEVSEIKVEVLLRRELFGRVYGALLSAHPYEEVAYDLYPLDNREKGTGLGRVGVLPEAITLRQFCDILGEHGMMVLRFLGDPERKVRKVALCTGAGGDFTSYAASAGADVYLTAEVKHHHALDSDRRGMCIVETDHYTLERVIWPKVKEILEEKFNGQLEALVSNCERSTWTRYP